MEYQFKKIEQWIGKETPSSQRRRSPFKATFNKTLQDLDRELVYLQAKNVVFQADVRAEDIRLDGMLRVRSATRSPKIILSFDSIHGPLSYPCDRFDRWEDNVRAIALSLRALRAVDRYGVTRSAEQYKGWAKLPAPDAPMSFESAARCLVKYIDGMNWEWVQHSNLVDMMPIFRTARAASHPDRNGGQSAEFLNVQKAIERIETEFKTK